MSRYVLLSDSTHVKANANKNKFLRITKTQKAVRYLGDLNKRSDKTGRHTEKALKLKSTRPLLHKKASLTRFSITDPVIVAS